MKGVLLLVLQCFIAQNLYAELVEEPEIVQNDDGSSESDNDTSELFVIEPDENNSGYSQDEEDVQSDIPEELDIMSVEPESEGDDTHEEDGEKPQVVHMDHSILNNFIIQASDSQETEEKKDDVNQEVEGDEGQQNIVEYTLEEKKPAPEIKSLENLDELLNSEVVELTHATIQILDKVSTNCRHEKMNVDVPLKVGDLTITLKRAFMTAPHVIPFSVIGYVEILEKGEKIFSNWMCGTYPSAITFDHSMFDVKVTNEKD